MAESSHSNKIQLLPEHIIDQIKAGEVIERPSTLLKELLENSIDAQATEIEIEIINNGLDLISVKDNGKGIEFEDLDLAFCRHATSKIEKFEDIYELFTYGFRGEALASIASVSRLTCATNMKGSPEAVIKINGGDVVALDQDADPLTDSGTAMFIRDLFFNTPARMKFIQSKTSEKNQLDKIVKAFLLTQPEVKISLKWDDQDKRVFQPRPHAQLKKRVEETIKKNRALSLEEFKSEYDEITFQVFLSKESSRGNAGKSQFIFVNDRLAQDIQIHKIILNSAAALWPQGETGSYCAYLNLPSDRLDVNIHPNKTQIKFFEPPKIFSLISSAIKEGISQRRREGPAPDSSNMEMSSLSDSVDSQGSGFKRVEYRKYKFDSENASLDEYFQRLDQRASNGPESSNPHEDKVFQNIGSVKDIAFIKFQDNLFLLKTPELMSAWMIQALATGDKNPLPLLVSQPLKLKEPPSEETILALASFGFEVDNIGGDELVLRTFPQCLKNFPYKEHLEACLNQKSKSSGPLTESLKDVRVEDQAGWGHFHQKAIEGMTLPVLIELEIAVELTYDKIKKIL